MLLILGKQLKQLIHQQKVDFSKQLEMIILQSISEKEVVAVASLAFINKYNVLPYIPSIEVVILNNSDDVDGCSDS